MNSSSDFPDFIHPHGPQQPKTNAPRVRVGNVLIYSHVVGAISLGEIFSALRKHLAGDWGELDKEEMEANELALCNGNSVCSLHPARRGGKLWIATDFKRAITTVLLAEE